ncbi:serine/threonine-protein phosphatase [Candidatus Fermentibacteria bacterium]|nr:serine/threonine-protein phosphatase [Candidatus Fermentibacteria bacterium]
MPGKTDLRLLGVSVVCLAIGAAAFLQWYPRTKAAWGIGRAPLRAKAIAVAEALGDKDARSIHPTLDVARPLWVAKSHTEERSLVVALEPDGRLIYVRRVPAMLPADVPSDAMWGWLQSLTGSLPPNVGRLTSSREAGDAIEGSLVRTDGVILSVRAARTALATSVEILPDSGVPRMHSTVRFPLVGAMVTLATMAVLAVPFLWNTVLQGSAHAGMAAPLGIAAATTALLGCAALFLPRGEPAAPVAAIIAVASALGAVVAAGQMLVSSRPSLRGRSLRHEIRVGWTLAGASLGMASISLLFPLTAAPTVAGSTVTGLSAVAAILLGMSCGVGIEMGVRPIAETAFSSAGSPLRLSIVGVLTGLILTPLIPGPWLWAFIFGSLSGVASGLVAQRNGRGASTVVLAVYVTGLLALPGLATSLLNGMCSTAAILIACVVAPAFAARRASAEAPPSTDDALPAYIQEIRGEALHTHLATLAADLQTPFCVTAAAQERGIEVGCTLRRAHPPAADICRIIGITRDRLGVVMGEVPEGGVHGAIQASILSVAVLSAAADTKNLASLPAEVERLMGATWNGGGEAVTMSYGLLDRRSKTFSFVRAGHQPVLLYRALVGRFERVFPPGDPLRTTPSDEKRSFDVATIQLVTKDLLIFFSDGLLTVPVAGGLYSPDHLEKLVRDNPGASCEEMAKALDAELAKLLGTKPPADDIVVLFLRGK